MRDLKRESLIECLSAVGLRDIPEEDTGENVWIKAIALVGKMDGSYAYVDMDKDYDGNNRIVRDFGNCSAIGEVKNIYPYIYLSEEYVPNFKSQKKEERIEWLSLARPEVDYSGMTLKELDRQVLNCAIANHLNRIRNTRRYGQERIED